MAYEELLSYKFLLSFVSKSTGKFEFTNTDPRCKDINRIMLTLRRKESSVLSILFTDPELEWTKFFATTDWVKVYFKGENLDGSAPEEFIGWASQVVPHTSGRVQQIEVLFLDCPPTVFRPAQTSKTYKKMTRKAVLQKLASSAGYKFLCVDTNPLLNTVEDELTHSVNESIAQFATKITEEIGSAVNFFNMNFWVIPQISTATVKHIHSNQEKDGSLLEMSPTFAPFMFEEKEKEKSDKDTNNQAVDPTSKKTESQGANTNPTNDPKGGGSSKVSDMMYNAGSGKWQTSN